MKTQSTATKHPHRRGGRPSQAQAARLRDKILDVSADVFLTEGYGATSIEAIARRAHISKRTLYARFRDKADLFAAVVHHIINSLRPPRTDKLLRGTGPEILQHLAAAILHASLNPQALALHRLILAEATRFPELAAVVNEIGAREEAVRYIAGVLDEETKLKHFKLSPDETVFAAEQFMQMIVSVPQRRAMGLGKTMSPRELDEWGRNAVRLFLNGCRNMNAG